MKKRSKWNVIFLVVWLIQLAMEGMAMVAIVRLNMLPTQYLLVVAGVFVVLLLLTGLMLLPSKKGKGKIRRGIAVFLGVVICIACGTAGVVVNTVYGKRQI